jgi:ThiF family
VSDSTHPLLPAAVPVLGREDGALQVGGVDSTDGLVLSGADTGGSTGRLLAVLRGLDGRRTQRTALADAADAGFDPTELAGVLAALRSVRLLVDLDAADLLAADPGPAAAARTDLELPAARVPDGTATRWQARRAATVVVEGATRVGAPLAAVLAASGVGRVAVRDDGPATAADAVVGGLTAADEGRRRSAAAADAVRRANPLADLRPPPEGAADLVVLTHPWAASDPLAGGLQRAGVPHLVATVRGSTGIVGPLVVPGRTSCLRCADLWRRDADPRWPALAAQLTAHEPPPAGATTTCLLTAATAALQALAYLDGAAAPVTLGAVLEFRPPDPIPRLRPWPAHPSCDCLEGGGTATTPDVGSPSGLAAVRSPELTHRSG